MTFTSKAPQAPPSVGYILLEWSLSELGNKLDEKIKRNIPLFSASVG